MTNNDVLQLEVVVSEKYVSQVLTDGTNFSFEEGVAEVSFYPHITAPNNR